MKFTDDIKKLQTPSDNNRFEYGVHKVTIGEVKADATPDGKEYVEITVLGEHDEEDSVRVWFTTQKSANYSFNVLRRIVVHNVKEANKKAAGDAFDALEDHEAAAKLFNDKMIGKECWLRVYPSPDRTYTGNDGTVRKSIDKDIDGYELREKPELANNSNPARDELTKGSTPESGANIPDNWN